MKFTDYRETCVKVNVQQLAIDLTLLINSIRVIYDELDRSRDSRTHSSNKTG